VADDSLGKDDAPAKGGALVDAALVEDDALTSEPLADFPVMIEAVPMLSLVPHQTVTGF